MNTFTKSSGGIGNNAATYINFDKANVLTMQQFPNIVIFLLVQDSNNFSIS